MPCKASCLPMLPTPAGGPGRCVSLTTIPLIQTRSFTLPPSPRLPPRRTYRSSPAPLVSILPILLLQHRLRLTSAKGIVVSAHSTSSRTHSERDSDLNLDVPPQDLLRRTLSIIGGTATRPFLTSPSSPASRPRIPRHLSLAPCLPPSRHPLCAPSCVALPLKTSSVTSQRGKPSTSSRPTPSTSTTLEAVTRLSAKVQGKEES